MRKMLPFTVEKCFLFVFLFGWLSVSRLAAQPKTETITYGNGTRTTTGPVTDESFNEVWIREDKDKNRIVTSRTTWKGNLKGEWVFIEESLAPSGRPTMRVEGKWVPKNDKLVIDKIKVQVFDDGGAVIKENNAQMTADGKLKFVTKGENESEWTLDKEGLNRMNRHYGPPKIDESNPADPNKKASQLPKDNPLYFAYGTDKQNCGNRIVVSLGPAYLNRSFGDETKSCWGVNLNGNYNITPNIAVGVDLSAFNVKVGDDNLRTGFYLAEGRYNFGKGETDCKPQISVFSRIAIGMMNERFRDKTGSGAVYGGGIGANYRVSEVFKVGIVGDYLFGKIDDANTNNIRISLFAKYGFGEFK